MDKQGHNPKIGILGGSFNPAHSGHLEISLTALELLGLDQIWWMVSPGNPLKNTDDMAPFTERLASATKIANDPRIIVTDIEKDLGTIYTVDTLEKVINKFADNHFIWLMGADNLAQFNQWKEWRKITEIVPFAIFSRPSYSNDCMDSVAALELEKFRIKEEDAKTLYKLKAPAWVYSRINDNPMSSTEIRSKNKRLHT